MKTIIDVGITEFEIVGTKFPRNSRYQLHIRASKVANETQGRLARVPKKDSVAHRKCPSIEAAIFREFEFTAQPAVGFEPTTC
jgi:hypothetical protein